MTAHSTNPGDETREQRTEVRKVVGVISFAHGVSHFFHLILAPLFPWLKIAFDLSYAELGLLMSVFFIVSGSGQALAGFVVDRVGPVPILMGTLGLFVLASLLLAIAPGYPMLLVGAAIAGLGNATFHPVDYSIINARVPVKRLGRAYAMHGVAGSLGWGTAPVFLVGLTTLTGSWRFAMVGAAVLAASALITVWFNRDRLATPVTHHAAAASAAPVPGTESATAFLRLPAVWLSFAFFLTFAMALGGVQSFAAKAASDLHNVPLALVGVCLSAYMFATAAGMFVGGYLISDPQRAERMIGAGFGIAAVVAIAVALLPPLGKSIPVFFAIMGFAAGMATPSRDMLVKRAAPPGATGRVYGVVYSGLDIGMAVAPAMFGVLMDHGLPSMVWLGIALFQGLLIVNAFRAGARTRVRGPEPGAVGT